MYPAIIQTVLIRELGALRRNVELYPSDDSVWATPPGVSNSAGTLVLHLAGNIQHYIGVHLGGSGYVRDRPAEFARRNVPRAELIAEIDAAIAATRRGLGAISQSTLSGRYPEQVGGRSLSTDDFLVHLVSHFGYHLGQVDYHRRLVTGDGRTANALPMSELPELLTA
ncbi:MAG TPA: DUF664 domain-containing protein [Gemmatimonadaceae bacterium]|jgi:uncharacterized damage-inducible protein DinB|nr:DUF664 domain-containing protein [Gemmatimonadaceae bacterium]